MAARSRREKLEPKITPEKRKPLQFNACLWSLLTGVNLLPPAILSSPRNYIYIYVYIPRPSPQHYRNQFLRRRKSARGQQGGSAVYRYTYYRYIIINRSKKKNTQCTYKIYYWIYIPLGQIDYSETSTIYSQHHINGRHALLYIYIWYGYIIELDARTIDHTQDRIYIINARITMTVFVSDNGVFGWNKKWNPQTR